MAAQPSNLLTLEQQFMLASYGRMIKGAARDELEDLFMQLLHQKMAQENVFKDLMRQG